MDAPGFSTVLTPEIALGMVQKALAKKNWKKYDIAQIKLVYSPYWVFSFDVFAEGNVPTGKAALNAFTGELNEFVPMLLDRPLKKTRDVGKDCEVEQTTISSGEVKETAAAKVAAHAGIKKDSVVASAVSKIYAPFYRIWVDVADDTFKIDVDACLGAAFGLEAIPEREKTWEESTSETLEKMKSPKGWMELGAQTVGAVAGGAKGAKTGGMTDWLFGSREGHYVILAVIILAAAWYLFMKPQEFVFSCDPASRFLAEKKGLFGSTKVMVPQAINQSSRLTVSGACLITNKGSKPLSIVLKISIVEDGKQNPAAFETIYLNDVPPSDMAVNKTFSIEWERKPGVKEYAVSAERVA